MYTFSCSIFFWSVDSELENIGENLTYSVTIFLIWNGDASINERPCHVKKHFPTYEFHNVDDFESDLSDDQMVAPWQLGREECKEGRQDGGGGRNDLEEVIIVIL